MDFASLKNVPILFVCENNFYSVYSNLKVRQAPQRKISVLAESHGIKTFTGDGNDVQQISEITHEAIKFIKDSNKPVFLELETFRWLEHCGPNSDDDLGYRELGELEKWIKKCPIESYKNTIIEKSIVTESEITQMIENINSEINDAFNFAKESAFPGLELLNQHIYKD